MKFTPEQIAEREALAARDKAHRLLQAQKAAQREQEFRKKELDFILRGKTVNNIPTVTEAHTGRKLKPHKGKIARPVINAPRGLAATSVEQEVLNTRSKILPGLKRLKDKKPNY